jgi:hypothetical protein
VLQQAAEPSSACYLPGQEGRGWLTFDNLVAQPLMRPLFVIVFDVLLHEIVEVLFTKHQEMV